VLCIYSTLSRFGIVRFVTTNERMQMQVNSTSAPSPHPALKFDTRHAVNTACAAWHLNRREQTLRGWACHEDGPIRPTRINGRLAWKTADLRALLGVSA